MYKLGVLLAILAYAPLTTATTCDACKTTYTTEKVAAGADNTLKCNALKNYLTCLDTSLVTDTGCPLTTADALSLDSDFAAAVCSTSFVDTCVCQKDLWKTDQTVNNAAVCTAAKTYVACLKGKTNPGCDGITSVVTLATNVENRMLALGSTDCPLTGTTCSCDIQYTKASISTDVNKCTALKNYISCLFGKTGNGCDGITAPHTLATTTSTSIAAIPTCNKTMTCNCEIDYTKTQITTANKCSELKKITSCVQNSVEPGCDASITRTSIGNSIQLAITDLGNTCSMTPACQCQINFAKADVSDSTKKCSSGTALRNCLDKTASTETVCDGLTTRSSLVASLDQPNSITKQLCSSSPVLKITPVFIMVSLVVLALFMD